MTAQVSQLMKEGKEVLIVSSGAIGSGLMVLGDRAKHKDVVSSVNIAILP